ncbi:hypothetical protein SteCoe_22720 [Stentor coeruleus]|uniref:Uncharacterized protein n=1 Tax=Stentor coeruleus TaxID=5963 RepID=A0A1R2BLL7_9CILI|nr:hypothetical protein SteCoe_22720 [Stentor coeruleus]
MNLKKFDQNKYTNEILSRQEKILEKTQKFKAKAILMNAQEKNYQRSSKLPKMKTCLTPRPMSSKHLELMKVVSVSHQIDLSPNPIQSEDELSDLLLKDKIITEDLKHDENNDEPLEKSRSLNTSQDDVLDSLVRFEGDSEDIEKKNVVVVNPNINLKLLFFDEQQPNWVE